MDADYVVLGSYNFDGTTFTASAQLLDMKKLHLNPVVWSNAPLTELIALQTGLAWDLMQQMPDAPHLTRDQFLKTSTPIRLDAFENYIRGILATKRQQKIHYLREAVRLNPSYTLAVLQLGRAYYDGHEYETASSWFVQVYPKTIPWRVRPTFLLGMSEFYRGNFEKASVAFSTLLARLPLTEVYNNLGVVDSRRGRRSSAVDYFAKAVAADPNNADYRFNLAVAQYKARGQRERCSTIERRVATAPNGRGSARFAGQYQPWVPPPLASPNPNIPGGTSSAMFPAGQGHVPLERIERNYNEASYRQLAMEIYNLTEQKAGEGRPPDAGQATTWDRGKELHGEDHARPRRRKSFASAIQGRPQRCCGPCRHGRGA